MQVNEYQGLKVLVVEDNLINQKIMKGYLTKMKVAFDIAENGSVGIELYTTNKYDCILMDIQMPVLDGMEATKIIREYETGTGRHLPIIAVTASAPFEEQQKFRAIGFDEYVPKPVSMSILDYLFSKVINNNYNK